jgi:starch-binding outer membrane protein, SusD/RagB family
MKRIQIILSAVIMLVLTSCQDEFLDREPLAQISPNTFFNSEQDLRLYLNSLYTVIPSAEGIYNEDVDNVVKTSLSNEITGRRVVPVSGGGWSWDELRKINYFLENHRKVLDAKTTARYTAEAKFFRAYFYFDKVKRFGDVPWFSKTLATNDEANLKKARDPRTLVMDSVLADIDYAIAHLPATKSSEKVTRWTALALKSRLCLYEGTFRKYHPEFKLPDADKFLRQAAAAADALMSAGTYQIYKSTPDKAYLELFASVKAKEEEVILARKYSADLQIFHNVNYYTITASYGKPGLEKSLVNSYLMQDGSRFTDQPDYNQMSFFEETRNRDPRLAQTIRTPGYTRIGSAVKRVPEFGASVTGYQLIKFVTSEAEDSFTRSINDIPVFRYAEVLLSFAEAKAELGELTQADLDRSVNLLRDRVAMPHLDATVANANPDPYLQQQYPQVRGANQGLILEIRRERRIELVMESYRWDDLMRWKEGQSLTRPFKGMYFPGPGSFDLDQDGKIDVVIYEGTKPTEKGPQYLKLGSEIDLENGRNGGLVVINKNIPKTFNEARDYLFPVPIQEMLLNENLTQNPEWK